MSSFCSELDPLLDEGGDSRCSKADEHAGKQCKGDLDPGHERSMEMSVSGIAAMPWS
jgi:hypothetical protein